MLRLVNNYLLDVTMRHLFLLFSLTLSTLVYAQKTLQEIRAEENLFIMKLVGIVVLILIAMPFALRKFRSNYKVNQTEYRPPLQEAQQPKEEKKKKKKEENKEEEEKVVDPVDAALERLFNERKIPQERRESLSPVYRNYIELKMGKIEVSTGSFDINTVFDKVMTRVHKLESDRNFEIVFDIDAAVPSQLIGDAERMEETLFYLIQNIVLKSSAYLIELQIKRLNMGDGALHLEIYIPYNKDNFQEEKLDIFTPFVEGTTASGLELYLAKEYARLMHGDITFEPYNDNDSAFMVTLKLYMPNPSEMRHYRLPSKTMINHTILIVDDHAESALAIKKMFEYFKNEVEVLSSKELFSALEMLDDYDIVVLQERFFSKQLIAKVEKIKSERVLKAVSLNKTEMFEHDDIDIMNILDAELTKPVTVQKVFDLLVSLYQEK